MAGDRTPSAPPDTRNDLPDNAFPQGGDEELRPCGPLLSRTWDDWEQQTDDPHRQSCPHCREAARGLDRLESAARRLQVEATATTGHDTEPLARRILDVVRPEVRPGRPLPLAEPAADRWITEAAAARALRAAAETVEGVRAASCRLSDADADAHAVGTVGAVEVRLDVHVPADAPLPELAAQVRERVWEAADRELGLAVAAVDIRVTDLVPTTADDGREGPTP
ncbi:Asp23/Gls24 family envelope stress response protein [Streptomyces sp. NPDC001220]